jgi:hypothetical protein
MPRDRNAIADRTLIAPIPNERPIFSCDRCRSATPHRYRREQAAAVAALDLKIAKMVAARQALEKLADECSAMTSGPCPIIASFTQPQ